MSELGLPPSKRNRHAKNRVHESVAPTRDIRPGNVADPDGRESRAQTPQFGDLGNTAGEGANTGSAALAAFVHFHPCMTYFCWLANINIHEAAARPRSGCCDTTAGISTRCASFWT